MLNIAICDDDIQITGKIERLLQDIAKRNFVDTEIEVFWNGKSLADAIAAGERYDVIYLDIEMDKEDGISAARRIRTYDKNVRIIYVTSHESYMRELELCERHQQERELSMLQLRDIKHNMKNNLISILAYAENKEYEKMTGFIEEIMGEGGMVIASISNSGNIVIDSLIGYWYVTAQNKKIIFKTDICIPMIMPFKGADLSLILGNLLENAVEAAEKVEENKYINVKMKFDKNNLLLFVDNSYKGKLLKTRDNRLKSTKSDAENHGVGLASVYRAVAKYHGSVVIEDSEPGKFKIRIVLYSNVQE